MKKLNAESLRAAVAEKYHLEMDVLVHESIESTNTWALQQCAAGKKIPFACFAEQQTQGRGRRGKHWVVRPYSNIAMSIAWSFNLSFQKMNLLPLSIALAIVETLESIGMKRVQIKWPNDVYVDGKKISGILIETQSVRLATSDTNIDKKSHMAAIIGVGLNYDMFSAAAPSVTDDIKDMPALTDICREFEPLTGVENPDRQFVASLLLQNIADVCQNFSRDAAQYLEKFRNQYDFCKDKSVEMILDNNEVLTGVARGVNDNAELIVSIGAEERVFNSAQVSVKPRVNKAMI